MKGLWTQIILITSVWSFAFISLKMSDRILKYLFGLFNCLQVRTSLNIPVDLYTSKDHRKTCFIL